MQTTQGSSILPVGRCENEQVGLPRTVCSTAMMKTNTCGTKESSKRSLLVGHGGFGVSMDWPLKPGCVSPSLPPGGVR
eukprot:scaffold114735_cov34-Tisochrysis_lutea.AAC.3